MDQDLNRPPPDEREPSATRSLPAAMRALYGAPPELENQRDHEIRSAIAAHFKQRQPRRVRWHSLSWAAAIAAAVTLAIWLTWPNRQATPPESLQLSKLEPRDIDRNGRVDVLDAFALARSIKNSGTSQTGVDLNGDGTCDQADVDAIAMHAVSLKRETQS